MLLGEENRCPRRLDSLACVVQSHGTSGVGGKVMRRDDAAKVED